MPQRLISVEQIDFTPRHDVLPSPRDWRDQFIYQLLIDRFDDNKDHPSYDPPNAKRGRDVSQSWVFQGGKIKGITRRLDYIKDLGCTTIWISPPFKTRQDDPGSYHGYGIQDFLAVEPRFGTLEDLQELVREAHARRMYVIFDIVINHTADVFRYKGDGDHPFKPDGQYEFGHWHKISSSNELGPDDAIWPVEFQDPAAFKLRGAITNLTGAGPEESISGDFFSLKDLDLNNPKVMDTLIKCFKYWIAACDVDGYRIDTVRNVESAALAIFCSAIREYAQLIGKDNFFLFGEIVGDDDLLNKYIASNTRAPGNDQWFPRLDAVLDFPLYAVLDEVIKGQKSCADLRGRYEHFRKFFRHFGEAGKNYVTFIDNHDQGHRPFRRFMNNVGDDRVGVLGIGYLLTNMGIPSIYYGTEQGFDGGGDRDTYVREAMFGGTWGAFDTTGHHFFNDKHSIYQGIAKIAAVVKREPALRYGRQYFRDVSVDGKKFGCPTDGKCTLAFSRILDTDEVLVALNLDMNPRNDWIVTEYHITRPGAKMFDLLNGGDGHEVVAVEKIGSAVRVPLDGRQMRILKAKR